MYSPLCANYQSCGNACYGKWTHDRNTYISQPVHRRLCLRLDNPEKLAQDTYRRRTSQFANHRWERFCTPISAPLRTGSLGKSHHGMWPLTIIHDADSTLLDACFRPSSWISMRDRPAGDTESGLASWLTIFFCLYRGHMRPGETLFPPRDARTEENKRSRYSRRPNHRTPNTMEPQHTTPGNARTATPSLMYERSATTASPTPICRHRHQ